MKHGYIPSFVDSNVYFKSIRQYFIIITVYVDDTLLFSNNIELIKDAKKMLSSKFKMSDFDKAHYCLGTEIYRDKKQNLIYITQQRYIYNMLDRYNLMNCKLAHSPMDPGLELSKDQCPQTKVEKEQMQEFSYHSFMMLFKTQRVLDRR